MFVSIHLMTCRHFWQCFCPSISWAVDTFDNVSIHLMTCRHIWQCVHPSHDLQTLWTVFVFIHLMTCRHIWQCLCPSISWPADTFDSVHPSHDRHTFDSAFIHLMTCRHFWQCLCPSIVWPAVIFDSLCIHPFHDVQTLLRVGLSLFLQIVSRVKVDNDAIILYFRHHEKDTLSTCGT